MKKPGYGIPDSVITASWRPGDGARFGFTPMVCLDCGHEFAQKWERSYGSCSPVDNEECPECGSGDIEEGGTADPGDQNDILADMEMDRRKEKLLFRRDR